MDYLLIKAVHLIVMMTWMGGLAVLSLTLICAETEAFPAKALLDLDRYLMTPSMLLTWLMGLVLIVSGDWLPFPAWLISKLVLVFGLSIYHGVVAGHIRRKNKFKEAPIPLIIRKSALYLPVALPVIVLCVSLKPGN